MLKSTHEIRDPIHGFIRIDSTERTSALAMRRGLMV